MNTLKNPQGLNMTIVNAEGYTKMLGYKRVIRNHGEIKKKQRVI